MRLSTAGDAMWNRRRYYTYQTLSIALCDFWSTIFSLGSEAPEAEPESCHLPPFRASDKTASSQGSLRWQQLQAALHPRIRGCVLLLSSQFQNRDRFHSQSYRLPPSSTCPTPSVKPMSQWASPRNGTCFLVDASDLIRCMRALLFIGRRRSATVGVATVTTRYERV